VFIFSEILKFVLYMKAFHPISGFFSRVSRSVPFSKKKDPGS
jgi:hypothetical protein